MIVDFRDISLSPRVNKIYKATFSGRYTFVRNGKGNTVDNKK